MRKVLMVVAALGATGGSALADGNDDAVRANGQTVMVHRYAFDTAGRSEDEMAAARCGGGQIGVTHRRHTMGDVAAAVFSGGWYTPEHVDIQCSQSARLP
jgi:hypothetical protein